MYVICKTVCKAWLAALKSHRDHETHTHATMPRKKATRYFLKVYNDWNEHQHDQAISKAEMGCETAEGKWQNFSCAVEQMSMTWLCQQSMVILTCGIAIVCCCHIILAS